MRKKKLGVSHERVSATRSTLDNMRCTRRRAQKQSSETGLNFMLPNGISDIEDFEFAGLTGEEALDAWNNIYG